MTIDERLSGLNSDEITQLLTVIEIELLTLESNNDMVENEISRIDREMLKLMDNKKEMEDTVRKGRQLVREKKLDLRICTRRFWSVKGGL